MKVFDYRERDPLPLESLFPTDILDDPWIVYHGTSGALEAEIDTNGIRAAKSIVGADVIRCVVDVFNRLRWYGAHGGGYPALSGYSTFDVDQGRPAFLAMSALRAMTYADVDHAGGEAARAMHHALDDLEVLLAAHGSQSREPDEEWPELSEETRRVVLETVLKLKELRESIRLVREAHTHGVVYAVRLKPRDLVRVTYHMKMGLMFHGAIGPDRRVAKALLPPRFEQRPGGDPQRSRFFMQPVLLRYIEAVAKIRSSQPEIPEEALAAAVEAAVRRAV